MISSNAGKEFRRQGSNLYWIGVAMGAYPILKPILPKPLLIYLRSRCAMLIQKCSSGVWPIDENSDRPPETWRGWPGGKRFALVLTHDVEGDLGQKNCHELVELEIRLGFRSSFNFVAEGYQINRRLQNYIVEQGFEVGVHGLTHRGNLFRSEEAFRETKAGINRYLKQWQSVGFRTPSMYHNLEWISELEIEYDSSTFDTDPFEPQPDGVGTIFPFWVEGQTGRGGFVELPYTLPQDFTLFLLLKEKSIDVWKRKLRWIVEKGGMALVNTHPDYMRFDHAKTSSIEYPARHYEDFLSHILSEYEGQYWHVLPREMARFWRESFVNRASGINSQGQKDGKSQEDGT